MTKITIDRSVVEQALMALNLVADEGESSFPRTLQEAISDLEVALAEPVEEALEKK